jgi:hypothetical protein
MAVVTAILFGMGQCNSVNQELLRFLYFLVHVQRLFMHGQGMRHKDGFKVAGL